MFEYKVSEYQIIMASIDDISDKVERAIADGWRLYKAPYNATDIDDKNHYLCQAMIKIEK